MRTRRAPLRRSPPAPLRRCERCSCTEQSACVGGCAWVPTFLASGRYVCTSCVGPAERSPMPTVHARPSLKMHGYLSPQRLAPLTKGGRQPTLAEMLKLFKGEYGDRSIDCTVEIQLQVDS